MLYRSPVPVGKTPEQSGQMDGLFREIVVFCRQMVTAPPLCVRIRLHKDKKAIPIAFSCSPVTAIGYIATVLRESFLLGRKIINTDVLWARWRLCFPGD